jgi:hypothetical protein
MEIRGNQVIPVADTDGVRVGLVGEEDGIAVRSVARVAPGGFRGVLAAAEKRQREEREEEDAFHRRRFQDAAR